MDIDPGYDRVSGYLIVKGKESEKNGEGI